MKVSSATSARATPAPRPTGPSSAKPRLTRTSAESFTLSGPSDLPNPEFNAYRRDLADIALAGRVMASHYAEPLQCVVTTGAEVRSAPSADAPVLCKLAAGEVFEMLDDSLGWAWGYAGEERRVGYMHGDALSPGD